MVRGAVSFTLFILSFTSAHNNDDKVSQRIKCYKLRIYSTEDSFNKTSNYMKWYDIESFPRLQDNNSHYGIYCYNVKDNPQNESDTFTINLNLDEEPWDNNAMLLFQTQLFKQFFNELGNNPLMEKLHLMGTACYSANLAETNDTNTVDIMVKDINVTRHGYLRQLSFNKVYETQSPSFRDRTVCILFYPINNIISCLEKNVKISENGKMVNIDKAKDDCLPTRPTVRVPIPLEQIITIGYSISICVLLIIIILALFVSKLRHFPKNLILCLTIASIIEKSMLLLLLHAQWEAKYCFIIYFLHRYSILAMNAWMLIIGIDVFLISRCKPSSIRIPRTEEDYARKERSKFIKYNFIAWLSPIIIPIIDIIISTTTPEDNLFHYRLLKDSCLIWKQITVFTFYSPFIILVWLSNWILLTLTLRNYSALLRKTQTNELNNDETKKKMNYYHMFWKLIILFGIMSIFDIVGDLTGIIEIAITGYIINSAQSFFILFIFVGSKEIFLEIKKQLISLRGQSI